jgi:hypothetical protein
MILITLFWTLILMAGVSGICSAQSTLYFPQIADGIQGNDLGWATAIALTNTAAIGTATASGTITFTQDNGTPLNLLLVDEQERPLANGNSVSFEISGGQTRFFLTGRFTGAISALKTGYATVTSTQPLAGSAIFIQALAAKQIGEASVFAAAPLTRQTCGVLKGPGLDTGVAVANPGTSTANVTFQLLNTDGVIIATATRNLEARNHTAFFTRELFPNAPAAFYGSLRINSDTGIVATALFFDDSGPFSTLPVFPLQ